MVRTCNAVAVDEKKKGDTNKGGGGNDPELGAMEKKWKKYDFKGK